MVASGVFPGSDPMNPMRTAVLFVVSETGVSDTKGNELSDGARGDTRESRGDAAAATPPRRRRESRAIFRKHRAGARERAGIDARAARVRRPRVELQTPPSHRVSAGGPELTRVRQKRAAEGRAGGASERARGAARPRPRGKVAPRATPAFGGIKRTRSRTHLVTSPVVMSRRSCLSTRTAAFLNTPPVAAVREGGGQKVGERGSKTRFDVTAYHERSIAPIAEAFHFSRVPRLSVSDRHAMPVAAAWDVSVPLRAC